MDLSPGEITALHALAITGTIYLARLQSVVDQHSLRGLEQRGFLTYLENETADPKVAIRPPTVGEYFRRQKDSRIGGYYAVHSVILSGDCRRVVPTF
ncbi:hypothetical protein AB4Y87_19930 [Paenarthrobacter sp. RAF54_2]|uniref:hypothetical protein n=1 Tax=Paenarthrobacter sp. RAF54_2 TaxID=3233061 RepID=UPI003F9A3FF9